MRIYERLWQLPPETLTSAPLGSSEEGDAWLGSRIIKVYGKDWLTGASRWGYPVDKLCRLWISHKAP